MLNETYELDNDFIIKLYNDFDADSVRAMKDEIETYSNLSANIIFDLRNVNFIDSSGIGAIVYLYKRMAAKGFRVCVIGLSQQPLELFQMLFLDKTIQCYQDVSTYVAHSSRLQVAS